MKKKSFLFGGHFLWSFFGQVWGIWAKILRTPKNLPAPTPMRKTLFHCTEIWKKFCNDNNYNRSFCAKFWVSAIEKTLTGHKKSSRGTYVVQACITAFARFDY